MVSYEFILDIGLAVVSVMCTLSGFRHGVTYRRFSQRDAVLVICDMLACWQDIRTHGRFLSGPPQIEHPAVMVYIRAWWRPKRTAHESSSAPRAALAPYSWPWWGSLTGKVAMRPRPPGQTMEATLHCSEFSFHGSCRVAMVSYEFILGIELAVVSVMYTLSGFGCGLTYRRF